ncbi:MAG: site-2 protease family protein, partial [Planctomycetia bacterium]|nr:site-2 protease family protein [Planctomycetia bacterium]
HEWGHFIVARMCGVRCDKFYIWFDAFGFKFFHFRWGNTEYGLGWLPLGGYVKMFGQEDNPGGIQAEIERAKQIAVNPEIAGKGEKIQSEEEIQEMEKSLYAPDSYQSKNVFQRMAIISAGVIMNVIFAVICATGAIMIGFQETSSRLGNVLPGTPAWKNDLRPGDRIVGMNDQKVEGFAQIQAHLLGGEQIPVMVERPGEPKPFKVDIQPEKKKNALNPTIGVGPAASCELAKIPKPWQEKLDPAESKKAEEKFKLLKGGDRLVSMNGVAVDSSAGYEILSRRFLSDKISYRFQPKNTTKDVVETKTILLDPVPMKESGIRLEIGEIAVIRKGSPAERAGLHAASFDAEGNKTAAGDTIFAVNNEPVLDPLKFPYQMFKLATPVATDSVDKKSQESQPAKTDKADKTDKTEVAKSDKAAASQAESTAPVSAGKTVVLTVIRDGKHVDVPVTLEAEAAYTGVLSNDGMLACGQLGIAYQVHARVGGLDSGANCKSDKSPLTSNIISIGAKIAKPGKDASETSKKLYEELVGVGRMLKDGQTVEYTPGSASSDAYFVSWFCNLINYFPVGTELTIDVQAKNGDKAKIETAVREAKDVFLVDRGLAFGVDTHLQRSESVLAALQFGWNKTVEMMGLVFKFLKNVGKSVSAKALGGPVMIVGTAYAFTGTGDGLFLLFLCIIGANLAVVNFLPIPVLDGGHMVFLLYEAIFRRPPNETVMVVLSYMGLLLLLSLMFWVIGLDVFRCLGLL